ncbi:MAG TPA: winged helix-turn-helix domain-containing protein [Candidatus Baltobacteraceae bacterium]|nr:winged helix-turn-helix domain-containing protein [Candidatus Baltobacteraceae bacterium]
MQKKEYRDRIAIFCDILEASRTPSLPSDIASAANLSFAKAIKELEVLKASGLVKGISDSEVSSGRKTPSGRDWGTKFVITDGGIEFLRQHDNVMAFLRA